MPRGVAPRRPSRERGVGTARARTAPRPGESAEVPDAASFAPADMNAIRSRWSHGARFGQLGERGCAGGGVDARDQVGEHPDTTTRREGIQGGRPDAVVGGDAGDVDVADAARVEDVRGGQTVVGDALEERVGGPPLPLLEVVGDTGGVEDGVVVGPVRPADAVHRPGVDEVRRGREVSAVVVVAVMPIARRHDHRIPGGVRIEVVGDAFGHRVPALYPQRAALGEVVLHVDDEEGAAHVSSLRAWRGARPPPFSAGRGRTAVTRADPGHRTGAELAASPAGEQHHDGGDEGHHTQRRHPGREQRHEAHHRG